MESTMASFKYAIHLRQDSNNAFDQKHPPGIVAPYAGIYRCVVCGDEIGIAQGHTLPQQNHHQHPAGRGRIEWQLLVQAHGH